MFRSILKSIAPYIPRWMRPRKAVVPVVRLSGVIGSVSPLMPGMTLASVSKQLERAFAVKNAKAVAIVINSPGGSPVQSHLIYQRIRALSEEKKRKVFVFVEDAAASGGYMIACAGDEIVADVSSIVGSIGVVSASFGFERLMEKLGVERRVYTAGERKVTLDPFKPENPEDVKRLEALQKEIHEHFIALVKESRGGKLKGQEKALFSGEFWSGKKAHELGLVDEIGDLRGTLRKRFGKKVSTPLIAAPASLFRRMRGATTEMPGANWAETLISTVEARSLWSRYGL